MSYLKEQATRNEDGELIYKNEWTTKAGDTIEDSCNVTKLYQTGTRKTGDVELLLIEAEFHDNGDGGANPAKPVNAEVAKEAIERIQSEGLEPAWRAVDGDSA